MKTVQRTLAARLFALTLPFAIALGALACAAPAGDVDEEPAAQTARAADDGETAEQSQALKNTGGGGGGQGEDCMLRRGACYQACGTSSGGSDCYRYCDVVYAQCRGLPLPELGMARSASAP